MNLSDFDHGSWRGLLGVGVGYTLLLIGILLVLFILPYLILTAL